MIKTHLICIPLGLKPNFLPQIFDTDLQCKNSMLFFSSIHSYLCKLICLRTGGYFDKLVYIIVFVCLVY